MNSSKPKVICLFGFMATGKLSIGRALSYETGIKLSHNHLLNDFIDSLLDRGALVRSELLEQIRFQVLEKSVAAGNSSILTHAYSSNFVSPTGLSDLVYIQKLEEIVEGAGGEFYGIHLVAPEEVMVSRCQNKDRLDFRKLCDPKRMKEILVEVGEQNPPKIKNYLQIDTAKNNIKKSVILIQGFIN